ncbi:5-carboxymethyl-2-hydroxymuconate Delta-isomerase [Alteromonas aestuariivivens]|uniref:5-carboxymethyl-2-hydroxymuconate Delta-isomerase n=1 Tax=Alteromonas aestuariivivens TaxID=1938339 RepID=A0A3D8M6P5_9ALTE|nr:5-carboxymethyl-2-hydroxymuconate Delta-isomerase [Alteromonas aestuariivivens]RDV25462.1 5-carboxymethyl-2-hydroxymuconate Delta-isomerase [Alteromonas aestuariivivens]
MPHCVIEYARPIETQLSPSSIVSTVHNAALGSGLFSPAAIKTRAVACEYYLVGGKDAEFIHVTLSILEGRSDEQKSALSVSILEALCALTDDSVALSVDVQDMNKSCYAKRA